jgi:hypothetical protein
MTNDITKSNWSEFQTIFQLLGLWGGVNFGQKPNFKFKTFEHEMLLEVFNVRNKIVNITIFLYLDFCGYPKICCKDD